MDHIDALRDAFRETRRQHPFTTIAVVVLPEHLHWLCSLPEGDADFSTRVRLVKRDFTRSLPAAGLDLQCDARGECRLWQRRFWEHTIRGDDALQRHVDYIHFNPVKHGLVGAVKDWPHSSFHRFVRRGWLDEEWGGSGAPLMDGCFGEAPEAGCDPS